ncbi:right-handed parallel beta-helix repeat-containing protein [Listeria grandensis]|uniref:right-handed parallel beta-helix repeat-containing protein n=1 Tax=Listeria grandensis TaxID=1494963 RepID=UPI00164DB629|nr:right-handed parallel beta-helix repeat-containing protein [Listeria grandensis]MBC6316389.1 right-handed parallel beta-helix repeat-containing protein [Listeria grandensis]
MKKLYLLGVVSLIAVFCLVILGNSVIVKSASVIDLKPLIEQAGSGTLILKGKKEVTYIVNEPIRNVKCSIQGAPGGSSVKANFKGYGNSETPSLLHYQAGIHNIFIKNISFDLAQIGRGAINFYQNTNIVVENCFFTGYSKTYGWRAVDSSICFTDSKNITIRNNRFINNGYQYGRALSELNRCITIQGNAGDNYTIYNNEFTKVSQAIVVNGNKISKFSVYNNAFNAVIDNSIYLLDIPVANIYNNDFNKTKTTNSPDEGIVLSGGHFKITNNRAYNVLNKFIAINGTTKSVEVTNNNVKNEKTQQRPAVIAWRNNTAYTVQQLNFSNNKIDTDTAPANYDTIPIGRVKKLTIQANQFIVKGLANYQNLFSLQGQAEMDSVQITGNTVKPRAGSVIAKNACLLREKVPVVPQIKVLKMESNKFSGKYPAILNRIGGTVKLNGYRNRSKCMTGTYSGPIVRARLVVNGVAKQLGGAFMNGKFQFYVGGHTRYKSTDKVDLIAYNANNKQLDRERVRIIK